jgi:hypothetical protein
MSAGELYVCSGRERDDETDGADSEQGPTAEPVDHGERHRGEDQVGRADDHRLPGGGHSAKSRSRENVVEIVEDGVDPRELVEGCDRYRENHGLRVTSPGKTRPGAASTTMAARVACQLRGDVLDSDPREDCRSLVISPPDRQPPRTIRNAEQQRTQDGCRRNGHEELPAPVLRSERHEADQVIVRIRHQDPEHDVKLECAHHRSAPGGRRDFREVDRGQHRRGSDRETANGPGGDEDTEARCREAAKGRQQIHAGDRAQTVTGTVTITRIAGEDCPGQRAPERARHRPAESCGVESKRQGQTVRCPCDDSRVESEQQACQTPDKHDSREKRIDRR